MWAAAVLGRPGLRLGAFAHLLQVDPLLRVVAAVGHQRLHAVGAPLPALAAHVKLAAGGAAAAPVSLDAPIPLAAHVLQAGQVQLAAPAAAHRRRRGRCWAALRMLAAGSAGAGRWRLLGGDQALGQAPQLAVELPCPHAGGLQRAYEGNLGALIV